jgi:prefoldin subunit 4
MSDVTEKDIEVRREDQVKINQFSRLNQKFQDLEEDIAALKEELSTFNNANEELMLCMDDGGIRLKIGESFFRVNEDYANEYLEDLKSTTDAELTAKTDECENIRGEMDALKAELYTKFGSSINLESK